MDKEVLINSLERLGFQHFFGLKEIDLIILRGHLLLEENLYNIISEFVFHPEFIKKSDINFSQKVSIARSMSLDEKNNPLWGLILAINTLRNKIAHELSAAPNIDKHIQKVKNLYNSEMTSKPEHLWKDDDCWGMTLAVAMAIGFLDSFLEEAKRFKEAVQLMDTIYNPHRHSN